MVTETVTEDLPVTLTNNSKYPMLDYRTLRTPPCIQMTQAVRWKAEHKSLQMKRKISVFMKYSLYSSLA